MSENQIETIDFDEFQSVAEGYIERSSHEFGEMPTSSFFDLLFKKMAERVTETIELEGVVIDDQLILRLPAELETTVRVKDNEILIGDRRIIVKLKNGPLYPTAH